MLSWLIQPTSHKYLVMQKPVANTEYFSRLQASLGHHVLTDQCVRRYECVVSNVQGTSVAQTQSCWLSYPVLNLSQRYHTVLATDEYFSYAGSVDAQQELIQQVVRTVEQRLIITVRDFKNSNRSEMDRTFSLNSASGRSTLAEFTTPVSTDRQCWQHHTYIIDQPADADVSLTTVGTVQRRAVYFKQLAKFCFDAGCRNFQVMPNAFYRPMFQRHAEHVILVDFA